MCYQLPERKSSPKFNGVRLKDEEGFKKTGTGFHSNKKKSSEPVNSDVLPEQHHWNFALSPDLKISGPGWS